MTSFAAFADQHSITLDNNAHMSGRHWTSYEDDYSSWDHSYVNMTNRLAMINTSSNNLHAMHRYLGGSDESPFTANPFHSTLRRLEMGGGLAQYSVPVPDNFRRGGSPADTTSSGNTHWTVSHSDYASDHIARHPASSQAALSPPMMPCDSYEVTSPHDTPFASGGGCIALHNIQSYDPDQTPVEIEDCTSVNRSPEQHAYENGYGNYSIKAERYDSHHEYEDMDDKPSITDRESSEHPEADDNDEGSDTDYMPNKRAIVSHRGARRRSSQSSTGSARSVKRVSRGRKGSLNSANSGRIEKSKFKVEKTSSASKPFPCPLAGYGCTSAFSSKNEWKRHVSTQHIKIGYWRCDLCPSNTGEKSPTFNDFNRKDLFTQHLRRMHANVDIKGRMNGAASPKKGTSLTNAIPEEVINAHHKRCYHELRQMPPCSNCLFCNRSFTGKDSWHERMDHIGTHLEKDAKNGGGSKIVSPEAWRDDEALEQWLLDEGLVAHNEDGEWVLGEGIPLRMK